MKTLSSQHSFEEARLAWATFIEGRKNRAELEEPETDDEEEFEEETVGVPTDGGVSFAVEADYRRVDSLLVLSLKVLCAVGFIIALAAVLVALTPTIV